MVRLSDLSDRTAVLAAIAEFRTIGRDRFLERYGSDRSCVYFLRDDGELIATKPLFAAAYRAQYPDRERLGPSDFSGSAEGTAKALVRLGYEVVTQALLRPPVLGESHAARRAISRQYGGDHIGGIAEFAGDPTVNVFSDAKGPYDDDLPTRDVPFGYRGAGRSGPQKLSQRGNALLERARVSREAVRFWYRPPGGSFTFQMWCLVLGRSWVDGVGEDKYHRAEIKWMLSAVPGPDAESWPDAVTSAVEEVERLLEDSPSGPEARPAPTYADLVVRVEERGQGRRRTGLPRVDYARSAAARLAVLLRSGGVCESPRCTGSPGESSRGGGPILDVDHVKDLALGGDDHPRNMVAICPNCHACKTRGADAAGWRRDLARIAKKANDDAMAAR